MCAVGTWRKGSQMWEKPQPPKLTKLIFWDLRGSRAKFIPCSTPLLPPVGKTSQRFPVCFTCTHNHDSFVSLCLLSQRNTRRWGEATCHSSPSDLSARAAEPFCLERGLWRGNKLPVVITGWLLFNQPREPLPCTLLQNREWYLLHPLEWAGLVLWPLW